MINQFNSWVTQQWRIRQAYESARGTIHKRYLKKARKILQAKIQEQKREKKQAEVQINVVERRRENQLKEGLEQYLLNERIREVPGIGPKRAQQLSGLVYKNSLRDLKNAEKVIDLPKQVQAELNRWVNQMERQIPALVAGDFPGKDAILQQAKSNIQVEKRKIEGHQRAIDGLNTNLQLVDAALAQLNQIGPSAFKQYVVENQAPSDQLNVYLQGIFQADERPPEWFQKVEIVVQERPKDRSSFTIRDLVQQQIGPIAIVGGVISLCIAAAAFSLYGQNRDELPATTLDSVQAEEIAAVEEQQSLPNLQNTATSAPTVTLSPTPRPSATAEPTSQPTALPTNTSAPATPTPPIGGELRETATVVRVIDGDTIEVVIAGQSARVRLIGMDAPEVGEPFSADATEALSEMLMNRKVYLEKDVSETDSYDRLLRYVYLTDGTLVNEAMVETGQAIAIAYPPDTKYQTQLDAAEAKALSVEAGMWAPSQTPMAMVSASSVNIRVGPGVDYDSVTVALQDEGFQIIASDRSQNWYNVSLPDGTSGWVFANAVTVEGDALAVLPAATIPAPPTAQATQAPTAVPVQAEPTPTSLPSPQPTAAAIAPQPTTPPEPTAVPQPAAPVVVISSIFFDGVVSRVESDEYAEITNQGEAPVNLGGWRLNADDDGQDFWFPGFELQPGQRCRVYTNENHPEHCGFSFGSGKALWNNSDRECGRLYNPEGVEVSTLCY
ncbi:MAG: thermonuclease family protein [Chloroflexota bacterium]